jgi:hypothetical protein
MSLYEISSELAALLNMAETQGMSPEIEEAMQEHTAAMVEAFDEKADNYAALIRTLEWRADGRREEAKRIAALANTDDALVTRLRTALMQAMQATGRTTVQTKRFRLGVVNNGGKLPVEIEDETQLPAQFVVPVYGTKIDRDAIRESLERGEDVPGARLLPRGTRLTVK